MGKPVGAIRSSYCKVKWKMILNVSRDMEGEGIGPSLALSPSTSLALSDLSPSESLLTR